MRGPASRMWLIPVSGLWLLVVVMIASETTSGRQLKKDHNATQEVFANAADKVAGGQHTFQVDTFGDEAFWETPHNSSRLPISWVPILEPSRRHSVLAA